MVQIRVNIPSESRSVELDVENRSQARDIVARVLAQEETGPTDKRESDEWILRIKRRSEQGRWWSEQEILDYKDRKLPLASCKSIKRAKPME